jgi:RNA polymerase sigma factor (sigma-70 family)
LHKDGENIDNVLDGCRKNDRRAQEQLYRSYYKVMANLCMRYTKNEQDALEVLNTGFYKVFRNIEKFDAEKASVYTWIRTIIINSCLDFIKARQASLETGELEQAANIHVPPAAIAGISTMELMQLVRQLPPATRAVFNLYIMEGFNHSEIGSLMGISPGTSKWHLSEARKKLQKMIQAQQIT